MNQIEIFNETNTKIEEIETLNKLLEYATTIEKVNNAIFNVIIIDNERIREINREYRGKDTPTDVISFALEEGEDIKTDVRVLGDIYISIEKVIEQSKNYGHSFERELCFLAIHGFLHLLGYDHMTPEEESIMLKRQELILDGFGIKR